MLGLCASSLSGECEDVFVHKIVACNQIRERSMSYFIDAQIPVEGFVWMLSIKGVPVAAIWSLSPMTEVSIE